eukprot:766378-Hanusia_phi.AAC.1
MRTLDLREARAGSAMHEHLVDEASPGTNFAGRQGLQPGLPPRGLRGRHQHPAILQFSFIRRLCVRLSSRCDVIYTGSTPTWNPWSSKRSDRPRAPPRHPAVRRAREHLWDTRMRPGLMSARAAKILAGPHDLQVAQLGRAQVVGQQEHSVARLGTGV